MIYFALSVSRNRDNRFPRKQNTTSIGGIGMGGLDTNIDAKLKTSYNRPFSKLCQARETVHIAMSCDAARDKF